MYKAIRFSVILGVVLSLGMFSSGCAYMQNRGNDAKDMFDIGVTFSKQPHLGVYCGFQSLLGVGYAKMDGHTFGIGQREWGWLPMRYNAGGLVVYGYEQFAFDGNYDAADPNSPVARGVGLGMLKYAKPTSFVEMLQCPKFIHLGWIGLHLNCKLGEILDFVIGWTTLDIGGDDTVERAAAPAAAPVTAPTAPAAPATPAAPAAPATPAAPAVPAAPAAPAAPVVAPPAPEPK